MTNDEIKNDLEHLHESLEACLDFDDRMLKAFKNYILKIKKFTDDTREIITVQTEVITKLHKEVQEIKNERRNHISDIG